MRFDNSFMVVHGQDQLHAAIGTAIHVHEEQLPANFFFFVFSHGVFHSWIDRAKFTSAALSILFTRFTKSSYRGDVF